MLTKKTICDGLHDLVPFAQFEKREKHPQRSVIKPAAFLKVTFLHGCFSRFLDCTNNKVFKIGPSKFFFSVVFLSQTFMIHRTAGEGGGYFFNTSLLLPPASQALRH